MPLTFTYLLHLMLSYFRALKRILNLFLLRCRLVRSSVTSFITINIQSMGNYFNVPICWPTSIHKFIIMYIHIVYTKCIIMYNHYLNIPNREVFSSLVLHRNWEKRFGKEKGEAIEGRGGKWYTKGANRVFGCWRVRLWHRSWVINICGVL